MLITLQSNSDSDASDFTNFFKETVMWEPRSEIALVNASYNFVNGITISVGVNDTFQVAVGPQTIATATVAPGEYSNVGDFVNACTAALNTLFDQLDYETFQLFPKASSKFSLGGATSDNVVITITYDPQEWDNQLVSDAGAATIRVQVFATSAVMQPGNGILKRADPSTDGYAIDDWNSGTDEDVDSCNVVWATARDTTQARQHGKVSWKGYRTGSVEWVVGLCDGELPDSVIDWTNGSKVLPIAFRCLGNGNMRIAERNNSGDLATVLDNIPVADGQDIEIHIDQMKDGSPVTYARYFIGGTEIIIPEGQDRWVLRPELKLCPCGSFFTRFIEDEIIDGGATYYVADCATAISNISGGSGYYDGEIGSVDLDGGGTLTTLLISADANGTITSLSFQEHGGGLSGAGIGLTITGLMSGATNATADFSGPQQSVVITDAGNNYNTNQADIVFDAVTYPNAITITAVTGGGAITDFTWSDLLTNAGILPGDILEVHEGGHTDARLTVNAVNAKSNMIYNLVTDTVERDLTDEPLGLHDDALFKPGDGFASLTGLGGVGPIRASPLTETGSYSVNNDRETEVMLVNVEEFMIKSICKKGGIQKAVASLPYGLTQPEFNGGDPMKVDGHFYYEPYNMLYHSLENAGVENHNQLRVRITDGVGNPVVQLKHPTTITLDLRPRAK